MSISSITQASAPTLPALASTAKTAAEPAAATSEAAPDKEAASSAVATTAPSSAASAPNMYKLNPDGTVGPLHMHRPGHAPGVVHA